jgi:hypothetical protein
MEYIDWEDVWLVLFITLLVVGAAFGGFAVAQPHVVDSYYASQGCVWAHWTWHSDERVMCPTDTGTLPELTDRFNKTVRGK